METIIYKKLDTRTLKLLVARPEAWSSSDRRTAMVWIHGGGWTSGSPALFERHCRHFAGIGAVALSVEYRLIDGSVTLADCLADCVDAIHFIRLHASDLGIDSERIVAAGDSAGGYLAAALGTMTESRSRANAVIDCNGIVDLTGKWKKVIQDSVAEEDVSAWLALHEEAKRLSPIYHVTRGQPPTFILHGLRDTTVAPEDALRFYEAHRACGNWVKLQLYPRSRHAFILFNYTAAGDETWRAIRDIELFLAEIGFVKG